MRTNDELERIISDVQEELDRQEAIMAASKKNSVEYKIAESSRDHLDNAIQSLWRAFDPAKANGYFGPDLQREKVSLLYEETKRKEGLMNKKRKKMLEQLEMQIAECDDIMSTYPPGSDGYEFAAQKRADYAKQYIELLGAFNTCGNEAWEKFKWFGNIVLQLLLCLIPLVFYGKFLHDSMNYENTGSYRSRTAGNHVNQMTKMLHFGN